MTWFTTSAATPTTFILPDLVSHCKFPLSYHPNGDEVAQQSVDWLDSNCPDLNAKQRRALRGLQAGELTAYCYHTATPERLRVVSDFMNYLFHLDNISDGMMTRETDVLADVVMNALWFSDKYMPTGTPGKQQPAEELNPGKLARDFWARCIADCGPGAQARFKETLALFFESVNIQTRARDAGVIPDLESYIDVRRDTSGCKPCWALIEYALGIDLPDFVVDHPVIQALNQGANDLVTWSNDIFSYNVEQSRGDTHNMIVILMEYEGYDLQGAVDHVGDLCAQTIDSFVDNKKKVPSWGPEIDSMVAQYIQGLQDWIVGSLHWSFQTHRYFGKGGAEVKKHRVVKLLPLEFRRDPFIHSSSKGNYRYLIFDILLVLFLLTIFFYAVAKSDNDVIHEGLAPTRTFSTTAWTSTLTTMSSLFRPVFRAVGMRSVARTQRCPLGLARPVVVTMPHTRHVASQVTNRPGSQSIEHAATNVKEEIGNSAADLAKVIAGANVTTGITDSSADSFIGITSKVAHEVPQPILTLGLAGGLPYLGASATTVYMAYKAQLAASGVQIGVDPGVALTVLDQALNLQVTYGAVMLSALGALHWGMEFAGYGGHKGYARLALGTAPMVVAWSTLGIDPMTALAVQWFGFTGLWYADSKVTMLGWAPKWYSQYRFYLSILVGTCIIGSLAGTSYFGPVAGHGFLSHELDELREERKKTMPISRGKVQGNIEAVPAAPEADHFTLVHKKKQAEKST